MRSWNPPHNLKDPCNLYRGLILLDLMVKQLIKQGLRRCYKCKEIKKLELFKLSKNHSGGRDYVCLQCNAVILREMINIHNNRSAVIEALGRRCQKCGIEHEHKSFFDLDHIEPIRHGRGRRRYSVKKLTSYMVLCPNCHRIKTITENGFV